MEELEQYLRARLDKRIHHPIVTWTYLFGFLTKLILAPRSESVTIDAYFQWTKRMSFQFKGYLDCVMDSLPDCPLKYARWCFSEMRDTVIELCSKSDTSLRITLRIFPTNFDGSNWHGVGVASGNQILVYTKTLIDPECPHEMFFTHLLPRYALDTDITTIILKEWAEKDFSEDSVDETFSFISTDDALIRAFEPLMEKAREKKDKQ